MGHTIAVHDGRKHVPVYVHREHGGSQAGRVRADPHLPRPWRQQRAPQEEEVTAWSTRQPSTCGSRRARPGRWPTSSGASRSSEAQAILLLSPARRVHAGGQSPRLRGGQRREQQRSRDADDLFVVRRRTSTRAPPSSVSSRGRWAAPADPQADQPHHGVPSTRGRSRSRWVRKFTRRHASGHHP